MKYKHANSRLVYPCPECSEILATSWSVYRHLFNVHRKTLQQVKKLRDQVQAKAYYQIQSSIKKSTNSSRIDEQQRIDDENQEWMRNFETDNDIQMCGGCGKRFERRAALNSHSQTCQKRIAAKNTIVVNRLKRITSIEEKLAEKKQAKIRKLDLPEVKGEFWQVEWNPPTQKVNQTHQLSHFVVGVDRRKTNIIRKRKIGIQIRYDYTKPSDKSSKNCMATEEIRNSTEEKRGNRQDAENNDQNSDGSIHSNSEDMMDTQVTTNTEEIYSIIGVPSNKRSDVNITRYQETNNGK